MCLETMDQKHKNVSLFVKVYIRKEDSKEEKRADNLELNSTCKSTLQNHFTDNVKRSNVSYGIRGEDSFNVSFSST
ncbi:hypothetical protein N9605_07295 [Flavobacteriaceae bacterium]|nr:hypothetical protein [Flavobacteriaceae bacterium]